MKRTISAMSGPGVIAHNRRTYTAANVDRERTKDNIEYCCQDIKEVYHELFDEALEEYNAKQTRRDRMIEDYYEKIRSGKQEKPFYEVIFQIGNKDNMAIGTPEGDKAKEILHQFMLGFEERNPQLRVFSAHLHMDEATPHLHIDFVPFITSSKRGLSTRVSLKKALEAQGFKGEGKTSNERNLWIESEKEALAGIMHRHGIKWERKGTHLEHLDVLNFKKEQRAREVAELEHRLEQLTPEVENAELLAEKYSKSPEEILPEAVSFETAKSYREKKAMPIFEKMAKVIMSIYSAYVKLKWNYEHIESMYHQEKNKNNFLESLLNSASKEMRSLKAKAKDLERVKKYFGKSKVDEAIEAVKHQERTNSARDKFLSR